MVIEDLNKEIQEEHTDPELIREALREAVFNQKQIGITLKAFFATGN